LIDGGVTEMLLKLVELLGSIYHDEADLKILHGWIEGRKQVSEKMKNENENSRQMM